MVVDGELRHPHEEVDDLGRVELGPFECRSGA